MRPFLCAVLALCALAFTSCHSTGPAGGGNDAEVRTFLEHYFSTWSDQDMDAYGKCFSDQARISFIDRGQVMSQGTIDFLHGQRMAHQQSSVRMNEKPLEMKIQGDDHVKQAAVTWVLKKEGGEQHGTDFFTLQHDGNQWKIVALVFYGD